MEVTAETLSIVAVRKLSDEAAAAGDDAMVTLCAIVLSDDDNETMDLAIAAIVRALNHRAAQS